MPSFDRLRTNGIIDDTYRGQHRSWSFCGRMSNHERPVGELRTGPDPLPSREREQ